MPAEWLGWLGAAIYIASNSSLSILTKESVLSPFSHSTTCHIMAEHATGLLSWKTLGASMPGSEQVKPLSSDLESLTGRRKRGIFAQGQHTSQQQPSAST